MKQIFVHENEHGTVQAVGNVQVCSAANVLP